MPDSWLDNMRDLVFLYNEEKRYHEEYQGFDDDLVNGKSAEPVNKMGYPSNGPATKKWFLCTNNYAKIQFSRLHGHKLELDGKYLETCWPD